MNAIEDLLDRLAAFGDQPAFTYDRGPVSFRQLRGRVTYWLARIARPEMAGGGAVAIAADFAPEPCSLLLALAAAGRIVVPLDAQLTEPGMLEQARVGTVFTFAGDQVVSQSSRDVADHPLYARLRERRAPGLVLFTSGSTGRGKAALLDLARLWARPPAAERGRRTLAFMLFNHIGGINTMFQTLASGGCLVPVSHRSPAVVCRAIDRHRAQLLPTTPTFLRMLLVSGAQEQHDLSSLDLVTYGAEPMPQSTLTHLRTVFPLLRFKQTYGMSEFGILPTRSRDSGSLWIKVGGDGFACKILDGRLFVRADSALVGYLNDPSPIDADGWIDTGDAVEVEGEWIRILGRTTESINVGGQKVHPAEVESVLLEMDNVVDAVARGLPSAVTGQIVTAAVALKTPEDAVALRKRVRWFCKGRLAPYKIPAIVEIVDAIPIGARLKKVRTVGRS